MAMWRMATCRAIVFGMAATAVMTAAAAESNCQTEIDAVRAYVSPSPISEADKLASDTALDSAEQKCLEGDIQSSLALLEQAKAYLGL